MQNDDYTREISDAFDVRALMQTGSTFEEASNYVFGKDNEGSRVEAVEDVSPTRP